MGSTLGLVQLGTRTTIIVPCYNEANRLNFKAFGEFLTGVEGVRILFVDDGSRDSTASKIEAFADRWKPRVEFLRMPRNVGKAEAVRSGICFALANYGQDFVGFWDADLATPLSSIVSFVGLLESDSLPSSRIEIVFGSRVKLCGRHIHRRAIRHYLGRIFATVVSTMLGLAIYDTQCGAKLFRVSEEVRDAFAIPFKSRWVFDVEILARLLQVNTPLELEGKLYEYPLEYWQDVAGSKIKPSDFLKAVMEVLAIYRMYMGTVRIGTVRSEDGS